VIGLFALAVFVWRDSDLNNANPLLNLRLIATQPAMAVGLGIAVAFGAMLGGGLYVLPQYLHTVQTYSATQTGGFFFIDCLARMAGFYMMLTLSRRVPLFYLVLAALIIFIIGDFAFVHLLTGSQSMHLHCAPINYCRPGELASARTCLHRRVLGTSNSWRGGYRAAVDPQFCAQRCRQCSGTGSRPCIRGSPHVSAQTLVDAVQLTES
jgi:hypothetical protein